MIINYMVSVTRLKGVKYVSFAIFILVIFGVVFIREFTNYFARQKGAIEPPPTGYVDQSNALYALHMPEYWEAQENEAFTYITPPQEEESNNLRGQVAIYVATAKEPNQNLVGFLQDSLEVLMATTPEFTIVSHREDMLERTPAYRIVYIEGEETSRTKYLQIFAVKNSNTYILTYAAPTEIFDNYLPEVEAIIGSYRIK
ncbi:MAG: hypothetical protein A3D65_03205 [Candidatus Lloydbacteria bacterium RIFCSPHIGHO2_02_FULL_50_13]|uniref:PsbP C-terminal domain-containing protein n=1 Tax=Candidatus Lloydbacteria bacterium RIFCSPHIGHO2_02_FULL_50_13 TaxID=1798661 RepID=A0A1G2D759_9BACT|nr:MAG: hypothetical protein A3D65_03205 [Candidatus Lloydbacteria bacterium RIFCSPHIGHO2_02_FULL_50_13]